MNVRNLYPPVKCLTYHWFIYRTCKTPYTGVVLNDEKPSCESEAVVRIEQLARQNPGDTFGYGFWTLEASECDTPVVECRYHAGKLEVHSLIDAMAA